MELSPGSTTTWFGEVRQHAAKHPYTAAGLLVGLALVVMLLVQSLIHVITTDSSLFTRYALLGGSAGFIATAVGALPALMLKKIPQAAEDAMLGFAAGMMLAASAFSLLLPGIEAGTELLQSAAKGGLIVVFGMFMGVALMLGLDEFTPHEHDKTGPCGPGHERCGKAWLFVFAIALHNLPEGMAVGVSFAQGDLTVGLPLATAIALQDIPEGLAVALTLRAVGFSPLFAVLVAAGSGLLEPVGALLGVSLGGGLLLAYPIGLGLAAGAMLFVVSHEVIPETHRNGHQTIATLGLMVGFALMMILDTTLG
ncbi:MAG: ZIP family metal transporter [Saccharospirillaceae bacterium]|nr:ZIP family metal transporter [Saccharospirillaceae bacterium]MCD8532922.1 ZIP family metal transporter [Saccharospirillaceae bacterium]